MLSRVSLLGIPDVSIFRPFSRVARHLAGVAPYPLVFLRDTGVMNYSVRQLFRQ